MDTGRRYKTPESEIKDFVTQGRISRMSFRVMSVLCPLVPSMSAHTVVCAAAEKHT